MVMTPLNAGRRIPLMLQREEKLREFAEVTDLNRIEDGKDARVGFVTSGPTYLHILEVLPGCPPGQTGSEPPGAPGPDPRPGRDRWSIWWWSRRWSRSWSRRSAPPAFPVHGKDLLPRMGELAPHVLRPAIRAFLGEAVEPEPAPIRTLEFTVPVQGLPPAADHVRGLSRTWASITACPRSRTPRSPATSAVIPWAPVTPGTPSTPASPWAPPWAWPWGWTRAVVEADKDKRVHRRHRRLHLPAHGHAGPAEHCLQPRQCHHPAAGQQQHGGHDRWSGAPGQRP
jgi:hypothetical protein